MTPDFNGPASPPSDIDHCHHTTPGQRVSFVLAIFLAFAGCLLLVGGVIATLDFVRLAFGVK